MCLGSLLAPMQASTPPPPPAQQDATKPVKTPPPPEVLNKEPPAIALAPSKRQSLYANQNTASPADTGVPLAIGSNTQNNTINTGLG